MRQLDDTRPHNLITLASSTQGPPVAPIPSIAKLIMHRHVRIVCFRFPFVNLADDAEMRRQEYKIRDPGLSDSSVDAGDYVLF